jgi:hypothetical protein
MSQRLSQLRTDARSEWLLPRERFSPLADLRSWDRPLFWA